jgi:hypothetical protein
MQIHTPLVPYRESAEQREPVQGAPTPTDGAPSNLQPAVLETQSGVSGSVARYRHRQLCPTLVVVFCCPMSPGVGGHRGTY